jgi:hypothetical protein
MFLRFPSSFLHLLLHAARDLPHIVELYELNRQVKTTQIEQFLADYAWGGVNPNVKWVDDNHALAIFSCKEAAEALLDSGQKTFKARPYSKACEQAHLLPSEGERAWGGRGDYAVADCLFACCKVTDA